MTRDGRDDGPADEDGVWPYLRISVRPTGWPDGEDTVVLDRDQVAALRDHLSDWLLRCDDLDAWLDTRETP